MRSNETLFTAEAGALASTPRCCGLSACRSSPGVRRRYYQRTTSRLLPLPGSVPFPEGGAAAVVTEGGLASPRRNARRSVRDKE